jgi:hypothetical protein
LAHNVSYVICIDMHREPVVELLSLLQSFSIVVYL